MKNNDSLLGICILILGIVPIAGFSSLMFLTGAQSLMVILGFLIVAFVLSVFAFKRQKVFASLSIIILLGTAGFIAFAAMMSQMAPNS